ncbi:MAG: alpha/beta hydrolase [Spirochaetales bacterium]|nr:alpha/beta hydrolase [Spirochaetales bacterium]
MKIIRDISCIELSPARHVTGLPLIIFLHGFTSRKEDTIDAATGLARRGYCVVLPDAHLHGDHSSAELESSGPIAKAAKMDEIYVKSSENINRLIEAYSEVWADEELRVGLIGISMGGVTILHHITHNRNELIKAAVICIATPFIENHLRNAAVQMPEFLPFVSETLLKRIRDIEPSRSFEKAKDLPLLFLPSVDDTLASIDDVRRGVSELGKVYEDKDRLKIVEYKGIGHECVPGMFEEAGEWFGKWL